MKPRGFTFLARPVQGIEGWQGLVTILLLELDDIKELCLLSMKKIHKLCQCLRVCTR